MTAASSQTVLILGAASDIGLALARAYARGGARLILAARDARRLETDAADLRLRSQAEVRLVDFDVLDIAGAGAFLDGLGDLPDVAVSMVGLLGDQAASATDPLTADLVMRSNYNGPAAILGELAQRMEKRGSGILIGVSSVAGDRGRATNYVYGSAKAGFTAFLSGLRQRLQGTGVHVITVKPGFVDTRMTAGMPLPKPLTAQPAEVADAILRAQAKGRDVVYVRPVWLLVMTIIRLLPEAVFKRTRI
ncbi:MAG: SDR family oxidoreductase [Azospirillaceae bacterium]|nr:SDR family oxidoreductase [Azospirillaceae bacterium]